MRSLTTWTAALVGALAFVSAAPAAPAAETDYWWLKLPFVRLLQKYEFYEPLVDLVLEPLLAAEHTPAVTKVVLGVPQAGAKLEVLKFTGSVTVEGGDSSLLGANWVKLRIPVEFRYEVDLTELKKDDVRYLGPRNVLKVKLPAVKLARVVPDHEGLEVVEKANPFFRSRASWYVMKERVLREYLRPSAELLGQEKLVEAQLLARTVVQDFLRRVCTPMREVEIVIE